MAEWKIVEEHKESYHYYISFRFAKGVNSYPRQDQGNTKMERGSLNCETFLQRFDETSLPRTGSDALTVVNGTMQCIIRRFNASTQTKLQYMRLKNSNQPEGH